MEKEKVFSGSKDACQDFIRANRFSVMLQGKELRADGHEVWAWNVSPVNPQQSNGTNNQ